jgi:hypothetical protein
MRSTTARAGRSAASCADQRSRLLSGNFGKKNMATAKHKLVALYGKPPVMPAIRQALPAESYSFSVRRNIFRWANELTDTPATSEP